MVEALLGAAPEKILLLQGSTGFYSMESGVKLSQTISNKLCPAHPLTIARLPAKYLHPFHCQTHLDLKTSDFGSQH
jgi:hypothetical protein